MLLSKTKSKPDIGVISVLASRIRTLRTSLHHEQTSITISCIEKMILLIKQYSDALKEPSGVENARTYQHYNELVQKIQELNDQVISSAQQKSSYITELNTSLNNFFLGLPKPFMESVVQDKSPEIDRLVCQHLLREGFDELAKLYSEEKDVENYSNEFTIEDFYTMKAILDDIKSGNLQKLIIWVNLNANDIKKFDKYFEFDVHKVVYLTMMDRIQHINDAQERHKSVLETLDYARLNLVPLRQNKSELERMCCAMLYCGRSIGGVIPKNIDETNPNQQNINSDNSFLVHQEKSKNITGGLANEATCEAINSQESDQYSTLNWIINRQDSEIKTPTPKIQRPEKYTEMQEFMSTGKWLTSLSNRFSNAYCFLNRLSPKSSLLECVRAGTIAIPKLLEASGINYGGKVRWDEGAELCIEVPLCPSQHKHSIFACPVARMQGTEENPPMILLCGHAVCLYAVKQLERPGLRSLKCPYCPIESPTSKIMRVYY